MKDRALELAARRGALQTKIAYQRERLALHAVPIAAALQRGDEVLSGIDWLKRRPLVVGGFVLALVVWRPRRILSLFSRGWAAWRLVRGLKSRLF